MRVILIEPEAPSKPAPGEPCNGCGVCCLSEPCPIGMLVSRKRSGACSALQWDAAGRRYRCGVAQHRFPLIAALARRWIAAGSGCDSMAQVPE
jgi:hypothetical protein